MSKTTTATHAAPVTRTTDEPLETEVLEFRENFETRKDARATLLGSNRGRRPMREDEGRGR